MDKKLSADNNWIDQLSNDIFKVGGQVFTELCTSPVFNPHINNMAGIVAYKNTEHVLIYCNQTLVNYTGHHRINDVIGKKDNDLIWQDFADIYLNQERDAFNGNIYAALHPGVDSKGRYFSFFNRKYPWVDEKGHRLGIICHAIEINQPDLIRLGFSLMQASLPINPGGIHYIHKQCSMGLSQRETECLFYLIRGKTAKTIAKLLDLSNRTVESYIANMKAKLGCKTKSDLIEYAINKGFGCILPETLIKPGLSGSLQYE